MLMRPAIGLLTLALLLPLGAIQARDDAPSPGPLPSKTLRVWLMPNEPAATVSPALRADEIKAQVDAFNKDLALEWVRVVNTTDTGMVQNLLAWNPEYATPNWPIIKGQFETLRRLGPFARKHKVTIEVRILKWSTAFDEIKRALTPTSSNGSAAPPDVTQIGSTWVAFFDSAGMLRRPDGDSELGTLDWRRLERSGDRVSLRYINDVRMVFYWTILPTEAPGREPFVLVTSSWDSLVESLKKPPGGGKDVPRRPPLVFPTGFNLTMLHDYAPLVWAGGGEFMSKGGTSVDLTSPPALRIPLFLARSALQKDDRGPYRILAFPEMSHEEALGQFVQGGYLAVIEPVAFLRRWKQAFEQTKPGEQFWQHAGVANLPEVTFRGGSDLMVTSRTSDRTLAFELAQFLASDEACVRLLAEYGHLPEQMKGDDPRGVLLMLEKLDVPDSKKKTIADLIHQAIKQGREYPELASWPNDVESHDVLEAVQRLWRRIGEGGSPSRIAGAASDLEYEINKRIDPVTRFRSLISAYRWWVATAVILAFVGAIFIYRRQARLAREKAKALEERAKALTEKTKAMEERAEALREKAEAMEERAKALTEVERVRGFTSSALSGLDVGHEWLGGVRPWAADSDRVRKKILIIKAGLLGWRRGRDNKNWQESELQDVIWNAIILAMDPSGGLFRRWEARRDIWLQQRDQRWSPLSFVIEENRMRSNPNDQEDRRPFFFEVDCPLGIKVQTPFLLERALVCLIQNAINAAYDEDRGLILTVSIGFDAVTNTVSISNERPSTHDDPTAPALPPAVSDVINGSTDIEDLERRIDELLRLQSGAGVGFRGPAGYAAGNGGNDSDPPIGIGLVEAFCIARQCYGGLKVDESVPRFSIALREERISH